MAKHQIKIERELNSSSQNIIWNLISHTDQLARWLADDIQEQGKVLNFVWGDMHRYHETRQAAVVDKVKYKYFRFRWMDEDDPHAYIELRMEKSDITDDYMLVITDYATDEEEVESLSDLWDDSLAHLRQYSGV